MSDTRRQNTNGNPQLSNNERIVNRRIQRNKRNRRKKIIFRSIIGVVFLVVGVIVGLSLFFNINKIVVSGDAVYSHETVIKASGVTEGDNLIFLSKSKLNEKISSELTYIGSVTVKRRLPSTLELVVKKTDAKLGIAMNGYFTLLDENGKVLEKDLETVGENIILLNLGEIESAELGETVVTKEEKTFTKLHDVLSECERIGLHDISLMDISDIYNIKIVYQGRITLELGETDSENLSSKLALGKAAIEKQDEENNLYRGTINLTVDGKGYWSEEVPTTEPQTEENPTEETTENAEEGTEETAKNKEETSSVA
ncbi:MAG: FtsQ-type POTRA domain-containing protein [Clostridia bacterium]|nr:FtsQ-type POTRA domain-containing protein [Clostridia bacterium]